MIDEDHGTVLDAGAPPAPPHEQQQQHQQHHQQQQQQQQQHQQQQQGRRQYRRFASVESYVQELAGDKGHVIRRVLIANNGVAAVKAIRSIRRWSYDVFGNEKAIAFVVMATPEDLRYVCVSIYIYRSIFYIRKRRRRRREREKEKRLC